MGMLLRHAATSSASKIYVEDVFGINLRTGTGATATITGMPDLSTYGGSVHGKNRSSATDHWLYHTVRGDEKPLTPNSTAAEADNGGSTFGVTSFNANGYTIGAGDSGARWNTASNNYVEWVYRNAPKFYTHSTKSHTNGVASTVDLSTLGVVGEVRVKRTDSTGSWYVWHRSLTAGKLLYGEQTAAETTDSSISVSGTTLTLASALATGTYLVEAWAHDTSADGLIQCGTYTGNGSTLAIALGWEAQFVEIKRIDSTGNWYLLDTARGFSHSATDGYLNANDSGAEQVTDDMGHPSATGFTVGTSARTNVNTGVFIYRVIRRGPMRFPSSGTQVYQAINTTSPTGHSVGFPPDLVISRAQNAVQDNYIGSRLQGSGVYMKTNTTGAEASLANAFIFDKQNESGNSIWAGGTQEINWYFRRFPGVMDICCGSGNSGSNQRVPHNLTVVPELIIFKDRTGTRNHYVFHSSFAVNQALYLNGVNSIQTVSNAWGTSLPTATDFGIDTGNVLQTGTNNFVAILAATLPGISKVGSYVGNGTSQTIDCGFAAGARLVMLKCADQTSDWRIFDTTRGIVAGNDPYLALNTTAAEVTSQDVVDPASSGFALNALFNDNGSTFIFFAIA